MKPKSLVAQLLAVAVLSTGTAAAVAAQDAEPQAPTAAPAAAPATPAAAQERPDPNSGSIKVLVLDQTGAAIVGASVSVIAANAASGSEAKTVSANDLGEATLERLAPGRYVVQVESIGFETTQITDINVRRGRQEKRDVQLPIAGYVEEVEVTRDKTDQNINDNFSSALTADQIDALPDDEDEMAEQLQQMAGPGAVLRVNGFSGGRLPPKSQIAEIRFRFDPYSAENHEAGFPRVDIRTRPGNGQWRNNASLTFRDESLNARNAFAADKPSEQARRYQYSMDGPIKKGKTSFSLNVGGMDSFDTETIRTTNIDGTVFDGVASPKTDRINFNARVEHAINKNQMLRLEFSRNANDQSQLGVGGFELFDRAYDRETRNHEFRVSTSGPVFRKMRNEVRLEVDWNESLSTSLSDDVTLRVQEAFTRGGAQVAGGRRSKSLEFADNLDFTLGKKHALHAGILVEGGSYRSDESRNFNGTYTFASADAFLAGQALQFSQRTGDPMVEYKSFQVGAYLQDDFRVQKNLLVSYGIRYEAQTHLGDNINLSPRLSFAWTPFKSGSTTVRGGFGVFNDWYEDSLYEQALRLDGVHQTDVIVRNPTYPSADVTGGTTLPPSVTQVAADLVMPQITRASFGIEHAFASWAQFRSNYYVQRTSDEFRAVNLNARVNGVVPFPDLGIITYVDAIGEAKSQGIDLSMNLNYAPKRIFGTINYRLAKAMNDGDSATSLPMSGGDLAAEWGAARGDVRHRIFGFASVPLKYGFRSNLNMRYESGTPYNITTGEDNNGDSVINDRPVGVGRNSARGDGQLNVDLRLSWQKSVGQPRGVDQGPGGPGGGPVIVRGPGGGPGGGGGGRGPGGGGGGGGFGGGPGGNAGRVNFEVFAQVSNLTNTVNYRSYSGVVTSRFFGQALSSAEPRRIELGMRVGF
ncbi:MAG: carboxypeptidase regulatory-like domain-containing protein [Vicinamibacteraceae bacterium]